LFIFLLSAHFKGDPGSGGFFLIAMIQSHRLTFLRSSASSAPAVSLSVQFPFSVFLCSTFDPQTGDIQISNGHCDDGRTVARPPRTHFHSFYFATSVHHLSQLYKFYHPQAIVFWSTVQHSQFPDVSSSPLLGMDLTLFPYVPCVRFL
jgi:hypothetical protein